MLKKAVDISKILEKICRNGYCFLFWKYVAVMDFIFSRKNKVCRSKFAVVVQGPVLNEITLKIIKYYKWTLKNAVIIVSTWDTTDNAYLDKLNKLADFVVVSEMPLHCGRGNMNYQMESTYKGILKAREIGAEYVLKVRSNSLCTCKRIFEFFERMEDKNFQESDKSYGLKNRLMLVFRENFYQGMPFTICDTMMLGTIEDMLLMWGGKKDSEQPYCDENMGSSESEIKCVAGKSREQIFSQRIGPVLYLSLTFCDTIGYPYSFSNVASKQYYKDLFVFLEPSCEILFKYELPNYRKWRLKPKLSDKWQKMYSSVKEFDDEYKNGIYMNREVLESDEYKAFYKKKNRM